ncbi:phage tail protein [Zooshikella ganghwensis]|uniref:Phage tail collar domain-containing protein n=1 Tax=Zooshikella ganghwensis TaxID=202772 RepID=A0A4V1INX2_9GAMM|nr:phage tail protein [Zooshikella ganghwensis]RDH45221.1 hypothetical protein B9G39_18215 [Zooshikella ganghwensis]
MTKQYYNLLTKTGKSKLTNAALLGGALKLTKIKVGDGGADEGKETFPSESTTRLVRERWAGNLTNLYIDPHNKNWVVAEAIIPVDVGGFYVTEFGLYDEQGDLICIGKYPSTYKPLIPQGNGTANSLFLKVILQVANASNIDLKVDLSIAMASREYVDENFVSKSGGIFYGDIGVAGEIYTGINHDKRVYHEGHKPTKFDVGLGNLPNVKSDAISDNSSDKLATVKAVKKVYDKVVKHENAINPYPQYSMPPGMIISIPAVKPPEGFLKADGAIVHRSDYPALWAFAQSSGNLATIENKKEAGMFGPGDGSTTFSLPDLRGEFIRGWDEERGVDRERALGSWQCATHIPHDDDGKHLHTYSDRNSALSHGAELPLLPLKDIEQVFVERPSTGKAILQSTLHAASVRPRNIALLYCIKY